jgi:hypothetical protein
MTIKKSIWYGLYLKNKMIYVMLKKLNNSDDLKMTCIYLVY